MKSVVAINTPNVNTNFVPISSTWWELRSIPMGASAVFAMWAAIWVEITSNTTTWNAVLMGTENAAGADFIGILVEAVAAADADFATAGKLKQVWVPTNLQAEAEFTVSNWTFTAIDVFKTVQFASTSLWLDVDTAGKWANISWYISATRGRCKFNMPLTETA